MKKALDMDRLATLAALGESVADLVRESGLLRKKPGRRKAKAESEEPKRKVKRKPRVEETHDEEEEE